ncbi:MAG: sulfotransferase family protein [Methylococcaceae bacterium]
MKFSVSVPCALPPRYVELTCLNLCRLMNYYSTEGIVSHIDEGRLLYKKSNLFPEWIDSGEIYIAAGSVKVNFTINRHVSIDEIAVLKEFMIKELQVFFGNSVQPFKTRIFCIGWPKTGTTSITQALGILGIYSWHFAPWVVGYHHFSDEITKFQINLAEIEQYDALSDIPVSLLYRELDEAFPGSLFIFTTREIESWHPSAVADAEGIEKRFGRLDVAYRLAYGSDKSTSEQILAKYRLHEQKVIEYFSGRANFLSIDITQGNPWESLCSFLDLPIPDILFPHLNQRPTN